MMYSNLKILNFWMGVFCLLFVSCTENNTHINPVDEIPIVYPQKLIEDVKSLNYLGLLENDQLYPSYIMQAKGWKKMYSESKFAQEYITDDLFIEMKNPGEGVKLEVILKESEINEETSATMTVSSAEEILNIQIAVKWKYKNLSKWRRNNLINLSWEVKLDDKLVERYMKTFICRSINDVLFSLRLVNNDLIDINETTEEFGNFPWQIDGEKTIIIGLGDLIAGYVDEHSPLVEELKKEVVFDNYIPLLFGLFSPTDEELLNNVDAYSYLMQKHRITYGAKNDGKFQYIRTIDDLFASHQGYCAELTAAFASWAYNLGLEVGFYFTPVHVYPFIKGKQGKIYPWDPNQLCYLNYPDLSKPSEENFAIAKENFKHILQGSAKEFERDNANYKINPLGYQIVMLNDVRYHIPSLNISESYWEKKTRSVDTQSLKLVDRSKWNKFSGTLIPFNTNRKSL